MYKAARYDDAAKIWEQTLELVPDNARLLGNLGAAHHMLDRDEKAASLLQQALSIEPTSRGYNNLGTWRYFQGAYSDAVPAFEKAVALAATVYLYWGNLGDAYRWAPGQKGKAVGAYSRAIDLANRRLATSAGDSAVRARLAGYLAKSGDITGALAQAKQVENLSKQSGEALQQLSIVYEICGQRANAIRVLKSAMLAGYTQSEIDREPELMALRSDVHYQRLLAVP